MTLTFCSGTLLTSVTLTEGGEPTAVLTVALWVSGELATTADGGSAPPEIVVVNSTGDPLSPAAVADTETVPAAVAE